MHRIDSINAVNGAFVAGNPVTGARPTFVTAAWHTSVQEELVNVVLAAGIELDKTNNAQLLQALNVLIGNAVTAAIPGIVIAVLAQVGSGGNATCEQVNNILTQYASVDLSTGTLIITCPGNPPAPGSLSLDPSTGMLATNLAGTAEFEHVTGVLSLTDTDTETYTYTEPDIGVTTNA